VNTILSMHDKHKQVIQELIKLNFPNEIEDTAFFIRWAENILDYLELNTELYVGCVIALLLKFALDRKFKGWLFTAYVVAACNPNPTGKVVLSKKEIAKCERLVLNCIGHDLLRYKP